MSAISHQDNFATNVTTNQVAGVTTTPLDSIPTVDAPFYIALDALNANGKYEVVHVTSKTSTNINHAATVYEHTTAETVALVVPAREMNTLSSPPQGYMHNGKISVTDSGSGLVVAIKTLAGTDPSTADPAYVRIGDTVRTITAALSVTKADGTNWCNAGSAELATKEIDYFVYLGYNATDGVVIGFSRIPSANQYSDFSATSTNEKYCAISTITNAASTDYYEVIGRFAATLSAGAGYTWSVPTYTATNLIQRPIYETRDTASVGTTTGFSSSPTINVSNYRIKNGTCKYHYEASVNSTSNAGTYTIALPFSGKTGEINYFLISESKDNGSFQTTPALGSILSGGTVINLYKNCAEATWTSSGQKGIASLDIEYKI